MSYIFKNTLRKSLLTSLYNEVKSNSNAYYYYLAKGDAWDNEEIIPSVTDTISNEVNTRNNIVFLKKITVNDLAFIIPRYDWDYGVIFDAYDDNIEQLEDYKFYCMTANNRVYKCIDNNHGGPSLIQPYTSSQNVISTSDGYKWKYMYTIPISLIDRFLSNTYIPVINDVTSDYYFRGSIYSAVMANYGSGYSRDTKLVVTGNGYQKNNKLNILNCDVINGGSGYLFIPNISISSPFNDVPFQTQTEYLNGEYISVDERIYEVVKTGISSNIIPEHTCVCSDSIDNGTLALTFVGKKIVPYFSTVTNYSLDNIPLSGFIGEVVITNSGYGYNDDNPPSIYFVGDSINTAEGVCISKYGRISSIKITNSGYNYYSNQTYSCIIDEPFDVAEYNEFEDDLIIDIEVKTIVKYNDLYYKALNSGQLSNTPPTHDTGILLYGDVELEFVGELASGIPNIFYGYGYSTTPIVTISNPQLYDFIYTEYEEDLAVSIDQMIKYEDYFYRVINNITLPAPPPIVSSPPYIAGLSYIKTIKVYSNGVALNTNDLVYTETSPKRFYVADTSIPSLTVIPEHITGTVDDLTYIPLILPSAVINTTKTAARFTPIIENTQIVGVICNDPGVGYTHATITPVESYYGGGVGAQIIPNIIQGSSSSKQEYIELTAIPGTIERVNIENGGTGYFTAPQVVISGDGSGCSAIAQLTNGSISNIEIVSPGQNYSTATFSFIRDEQDDEESNTNAIVYPIISPQTGHSKNAIDELYANKLAICSSLFSEKINGFTLNTEYRQFGIIKNPTKFINKIRYDKNYGSCCYTVYCMFQTPIDTNLSVTDINNNEYKILSYTITTTPNTYISLLLHSVNNSKLNVGQSLYQNGKSLVIMSIDYPDIDKQSGELLSIDNRLAFLPNSEQSVVLKTIINL